MDEMIFAIILGLVFGVYVYYRLAFSELALRVRERLIPEVKRILEDETISMEAKKVALNLFNQSTNALPFWWPLTIVLLPFHKKIAAHQFKGIHAPEEQAMITRLHMRSAMVGAVANPIPLVLIVTFSIPAMILLAIFKKAQSGIEILLDVSWVVNNRDGILSKLRHSHH